MKDCVPRVQAISDLVVMKLDHHLVRIVLDSTLCGNLHYFGFQLPSHCQEFNI